jgi:hypothetical protein
MSNWTTDVVRYMESKTPSRFGIFAENVRRDIENNVFGDLLVFPKAKKKQTGHEGKFDVKQRTEIVMLVNEHRAKGMRAKCACLKLGVPYSSYSHWSDRLRISYVKK